MNLGGDGTYGGNLELDALTLEGKAQQSYAPAAGAAILCWVYKTATDSNDPAPVRWQQARRVMREMAAVYDPIAKPSDLDASENELPENVSTYASWKSFRGATVTDTVLADGRIDVTTSGGSHRLKYYDYVGKDFPAGSGFSEITVENQGSEEVEVSSGLYNRTAVAPGETKKVIIRHGFQAKSRSSIFYRLWAADADAAIDVVLDPAIFVTQQTVLSPNYAAPRTDEHGEGLIIATRVGLLGTSAGPQGMSAGLKGTGSLDESERMYA